MSRRVAALGTISVTVLLALGAAVVPGLASPAAAAVVVDDTPEQSWRVNGRVYAIEIVDDTVFVGGTFTTATGPGGQTAARRNLAAFDADTGALLAWRADAGAAVRALVSDGSRLYVGGAFGQIGGQARSRLARLDVQTAAVDPAFRPTFNDNIRALDLDASAVYAGGAFTQVNGATRNRVVKLGLSGATDPAFVANANGAVWGVAKNPTSAALYVAGPFSAVNGQSRSGVAAVSSGSGATSGVVFGSSARPTLGLAVSDDGSRLFTAGGTGENAAAAWSTATGARLWRQIAMGDIQAIDYHDGTVYFGFHDGYQGDTALKVVAADAVSGVADPDFRPRFNSFWGVFAIDATDETVVVGGEFTVVSGVAAQGFARFVVSGDPPTGPVTTHYVTASTAWRYWDRGSRPGGWEQPGHDDTTWGSGLPQLGYGDGDEATTVSFGPSSSQKYLTTYFRTSFTVSDLPDTVTLQLLADDGAAVYVNGQEVVRDNLPAGQLTNTTRAAANRSGSAENALRTFTVPAGQLHAGTNTIAVEVHQDVPSSSDLGLDLRLSGTTAG